MCGIAASIHHPLNIPQLNKDLFHRGPDEQANWTEDGLQLFSFRLAILDIAGGKQPMHYEHLSIVFNGQIYNHQEVRRKHGLHGQTNSDTETILMAYAKLGPKCLEDFDGMFVFALYDRNKNELFVARDRAGKKPLYYYEKGQEIVFASELNALRNQLSLTIDEDNILQYLNAAYFFRANTPYKEIKELPSGCYTLISLDKPAVKVVRWWDIHDYYLKRSTDSFEEALQKTDDILHQVIKRRVESSDLEVGSFLSGGIDSGLVTAITKEYNSSLKTFTISFEGVYDEAPLAKLVADKYQTHHHEIKISFDHLRNDIEKILYNYGEPIFDSSVIPSYYVSEAAKKHLTVILNGDGGDELFGGYRKYVPYAKYDFFNKSAFVQQSARLLLKILPLSHEKKNKYNYIYRLVDFAGKKGVNTYFSSTLDVFEGFQDHIRKSGLALAGIQEDFDRIRKSKLSGLQKLLNLDFDHILTSNLLVKMDIATMAHSLEGRSPLLAKELLEYIPSLPDNYKIKGSQTKYLLRKLAEKYLPAELIHQPKRGFEIPLKDWVDGELKDMIASYLLSPNAYSRNFIKPAFIEDLWNRKIKTGDEKRAKMLWTTFALEVWYRKCYLNGGTDEQRNG
ncbi:MAG TPA: asparagine synthase (glutamine-hydrolyzing) [Chitinophagaceae bacterium]